MAIARIIKPTPATTGWIDLADRIIGVAAGDDKTIDMRVWRSQAGNHYGIRIIGIGVWRSNLTGKHGPV